MRSLKDWFNSKIEMLKNRNLHFRQEHVAPIYSFYLIMKTQFSDYHIMDWDKMFYEFYIENYTDAKSKKEVYNEDKKEEEKNNTVKVENVLPTNEAVTDKSEELNSEDMTNVGLEASEGVSNNTEKRRRRK